MCLYPKLFTNKKYTANKKNGGVIPAITDNRVLVVPIKCGNCIECRKQKAREWQVRLLEDIKTNKQGQFVTLTFDRKNISELRTKVINETWKEINKITNNTKLDINKRNKIINKLKLNTYGYGLDNEAAKKGVRYFLERWRKEHKKSVRHWLVTELGQTGTEHIHIHGIIWTNKPKDIEKHWKYGYVWDGYMENEKRINYVNEQTINYITKYIHKVDSIHKMYKPIILTSSGIGANYTESYNSKLNRYQPNKTKETYTTKTGHKIGMPIYWRNKIYSEEEREKLWIEKLDKQERWIMGEKVDISKGEENYYKLLKYYQQYNVNMGYNDNRNNWEKLKYENERRALITNVKRQ